MTDTEVRRIEARTQTRYARGWHCLGLAKEFHDGKPHKVKAFGTELVIFEDSKGQLQTLDAFCPHMGGNLASGTIEGDSIACPFHKWKWDGSGKCSEIPYSKRIPPRARTKSWPTMDMNGQIYVYNDPEGNPPPADVTIPVIDGAGSPEWSDWTWNSALIEGSHCREMIDNLVDMAHFFYVHLLYTTYFKNIFEGHVATQLSKFEPRRDVAAGSAASTDVISDATYFGPSYMINTQFQTGGDEPDLVLINCHYPVSPDSFMLMWGAIAKRGEGMSSQEANDVAHLLVSTIEEGFMQDVEIWKDKTKVDNPLLCDQDGPVYQLRRWYEQFYVDVADIKPEMVQRFEFEIDTTEACESWNAEMDANIANATLINAERAAAEASATASGRA